MSSKWVQHPPNNGNHKTRGTGPYWKVLFFKEDQNHACYGCWTMILKNLKKQSCYAQNKRITKGASGE